MNGRVIVALQNNRIFRTDMMKMADVKNVEYDIQLTKQISSSEVVVIAKDTMLTVQNLGQSHKTLI